MFDIFYLGKKPNLFPHEKAAHSIDHARQLSRTRYFWIVNYLCDYSGWDWIWEPPPWQAHQRHAWGSRWQKDCGTYLVPTMGFSDTNYHAHNMPMRSDMQLWQNTDSIQDFDFTWHPDYTDPPYRYEFGTQWQKTGGPVYVMPGGQDTKYVTQCQSRVRATAHGIYVIDHSDGLMSRIQDLEIPIERSIRYFDNYRDTLIRLADGIPMHQEYVWVISSVCDYDGFDFSWHPETWQNQMLHVFGSDDNMFGDTFFMHVPSFRARARQFDLLEWYDVNFVPISVPRHHMPVVLHNQDSQADAVKQTDFVSPLMLFTVKPRNPDRLPAVNLWRNITRTIMPLDTGAESVIVPRDSAAVIDQQLYDYAYINRDHEHTFGSAPLDVVFISNGEPNADHNWQRLSQSLSQRTNRLHRVEGVQGRRAAYQAAAELSQTAWFFAVFAKLEVTMDFDWSWQPDRMQQAKHYIFHARNPVNELVYGHQAMIAYNRAMTLSNPAKGLDFTLDQPHEVVALLSGVARYNISPWVTWRTAFREALKLRHSLPDVENEHRLHTWLTVGHGENGDWSRCGADDALLYYQEVQGDFDCLRRSYEWSWLASHALFRHPELVIHD